MECFENGKLDELSTMSNEILDIDIIDTLNKAKQIRDIVVRQRQARKKCIDLLIQLQCQFLPLSLNQ